MNDQKQLFKLLERKVAAYNNLQFIETDPIQVPHSFSKLQDVEIAAFFAATFAWGQRATIINKTKRLLRLMDNDPYNFVMHHDPTELKPIEKFKHRTFNGIDAKYFIRTLRNFYKKNNSLESAFSRHLKKTDATVENALIGFRDDFFSLPDHPFRTYKHVASPMSKSTCKRLNMFLRWMVREDDKGVDFGLWKKIKTHQLLCPLDVHVDRIGRELGLITRKQTDWLTVLELTENLKKFDANDPVKYDYALFGIGVMEKFKKG